MHQKVCHRRSLRLPGYDYSHGTAYFVTICTADRAPIFGQIVDGTMRFSDAGKMITEEWLKTARIRTYVELDQFIVMPNHFHGILLVDREEEGTARRAPTVQRFGCPVSSSLPTIIGAFKSAVTNRINALKGTTGNTIWQRNYYEHVIRNEKSLNRIREYILNNPQTWESDRENPGRTGENDFYRWLANFKSRPGKKIRLR